MGYDNYMSWDGMTEEEEKAQITGFRTTGNKGYLRATYGWTVGQDFYTYVLIGDNNIGHFNKQSFNPNNALARWNELEKEYFGNEDWLHIAKEVLDFISLGKSKLDAGLNPMVEGR